MTTSQYSGRTETRQPHSILEGKGPDNIAVFWKGRDLTTSQYSERTETRQPRSILEGKGPDNLSVFRKEQT